MAISSLPNEHWQKIWSVSSDGETKPAIVAADMGFVVINSMVTSSDHEVLKNLKFCPTSPQHYGAPLGND
jgi:hypothetical protein